MPCLSKALATGQLMLFILGLVVFDCFLISTHVFTSTKPSNA